MKTLLGEKKVSREILLVGGLFLIALSFRLWGLNATGGTWDERPLFLAGRHYIYYLSHLNFDPMAWSENAEVPPVAKYIYGMANYFVEGRDYTASRVLSAIMAALTCIVVYFIGKEFFKKRVGILAALILAFLPAFVAHGKIAAIESPVALFFTLTVYFFLQGIRTGNQFKYLLSALFCGIALGTKFTSIFLFVLVFLIFLLAKRKELLEKREITIPLALIFFPVIALFTFVALWPWLWSNPHSNPYWQLNKSAMVYYGYGLKIYEYFLGELVRPPVYYFLLYFLATTPLLILILLVSFFHKLAKQRTFYLFALALWLAVPFFWSFVGLKADGIRYIYPIYPPLSLMAAIGLFYLSDAFPLPGYRRMVGYVGSSLVVGYLVVTCLIIHPYYLDYYNEIVGGPKNVYEHRWFEIGWWGEGIKEAVEYVNKNAPPGSYIWFQVRPSHEISPLNSSLRNYGSYADNFCIRWEGKLKVPFEDTYTFYTISDDGVKLWIDGKLIINNWTDHPPTEDRGEVSLGAGNHDIELEFYENRVGAVIKLFWSSSKFPKSIISSDYFYHEAGSHKDQGLTGQYYNELNFKDLKITRIDSNIDFDWKQHSPFVQETDYVVTNTFLEWYGTGFSNPNPNEFKEVYVVKAAGAPLARVYQRIKDSPPTGSSD